jgi:uncharacterized membrane protein
VSVANSPTRAAQSALVSLLALIVLCVAWEIWLAPLHPGAGALALKAVPLALAVRGVARRNLYTLQWASMLVLCYLAEGVVRAMNEGPPVRTMAGLEIIFSLVFFLNVLAYVGPFKRAARAARSRASAAEH